MDIAYLVWLQGIRESLPSAVEQFFITVSAIAISNALIVIPCLLYWCLDKRAGQYLVFTFSIGTLINQFVKNTVCCYRPWIRNDALHPVVEALDDATGYSFPSGHTQSSVALIGGLGWYYRKRWRVLFVLCWVFVALVAFSRNYLGVHTPQDVVVALVEGILVLVLVERLLAWVEEERGRDLWVLVVSLVFVVAFVVYVTCKPYPTDFDEVGSILVDPIIMQEDCFKSAGVFAGAMLGWFLERRCLSFEVCPERHGWKRMALRFAVGIAVTFVFHVAARPLLMAGIDLRWYELIKNFLTIFAAAFVGPVAFCALERRARR